MRNDAPRPSAQRAFGGHLTSATAETGDDDSVFVAASLSADAPEFVPGQPIVTRRYVKVYVLLAYVSKGYGY